MNSRSPVQPDPDALVKSWEQLRAANPRVHAREAAESLGCTEAQLVAAQCGRGVTRLCNEGAAILARLGELGRVKAITRNATAVIETEGPYGPPQIQGHVGLVLGGEIDLRLFPRCWTSIFAVEPAGEGESPSLQLFDHLGEAVHKVYAKEPASRAAYEQIVADFRDDVQSRVESSGAADAPDRADAEIDAEALRTEWKAMRDTHEFSGLLHRLRVGREQALRLAGRELAEPVSPTSVATILEACAGDGLSFMTFVGNRGILQIHTGPIHRVARARGWLNVLDPGFNLHLRDESFQSAWIVRKPTTDGTVTSLEAFDHHGALAVLLVGERKPGRPEKAEWRARVESLVTPARSDAALQA